jgi:hypothetical protein
MTTQTDPAQRVTQAQPAPPGTAHPDPVLAAKGWHASPHGAWVRTPHQCPQADREREAGG